MSFRAAQRKHIEPLQLMQTGIVTKTTWGKSSRNAAEQKGLAKAHEQNTNHGNQ